MRRKTALALNLLRELKEKVLEINDEENRRIIHASCPPYTSTFISKCVNHNHSNIFPEELFLNGLFEFNLNPPGTKKEKQIEVKTKDHQTIKVYSKEEAKMVRKLNKEPFVKYIRSGSYPILYHHKGKKYYYYPDLFVYTVDQRIIIIEVKPLYEMADIVVQKKWLKLQEHCKKHGLMCFMGCYSNKYISEDDIKNIKIPVNFEKDVINILKEKGIYTNDDLARFRIGKKKPRYYYNNILVKITKKYHLTYKQSARAYFNFKIKINKDSLISKKPTTKTKNIQQDNTPTKQSRPIDELFAKNGWKLKHVERKGATIMLPFHKNK